MSCIIDSNRMSPSNIGTTSLQNLLQVSTVISKSRLAFEDIIEVVSSDGVLVAETTPPRLPADDKVIAPAASFQPSRTTRLMSYLTSPKTIAGAIGAGAAALAGCAAPACLVAGGAVVTIQQLFIKAVTGGKTLRSATYIQADHLARLNIQGGFRSIIIPPVLQALEKMDGINALKARNALQSFLTFEDYFDYLGINNHFLLQDFIQKVQQLQPGQLVAWTLSYMTLPPGGHVILGSIDCTEKGKYRLSIHNGGDGVESYHYCRYDKESGRKLYQTTLEIGDIELPELTTFIKAAAANQAFRRGNSAKKLYELTPVLKGKFLPPTQDPRYWLRTQMGNSCSGYSVKCFLKTILTPEEYYTIRKLFLQNSVDSLKNGLQNGWFFEKTENHEVVLKELNAKLMRLEGTEQGRTAIFKHSLAASIASNVQGKFWAGIFPMSYVAANAMKLGKDSFNFNRLLKHKFFKKLNDSYGEVVKAREWSKNFRALENSQKAFQSELIDFYQKMDKSKFLEKEKSELENCILEIQEKGKVMKFNFDNQSCILARFSEIVFSKFKMDLVDPLAIKLKGVIDHLNTENFKEARAQLESAFKLGVLNGDKLTEKQKEEYEFVLCQTLYLNESVTLEDMELRAGLAIFFKKMEFELPSFLSKNIDFYQELRLDKAFPNSSWIKMILEHLKSSRWFPTEFRVLAPKSLIKLTERKQ